MPLDTGRKSAIRDTVFIEGSDFVGFPVGGQLSFSRQIVDRYASRLALVGLTADDSPVGHWVERTVGEHVLPFLSLHRVNATSAKPHIPRRLLLYFGLQKYSRRILSRGYRNLLTQSPEVLLAARRWTFESVCALLPGVGNPLEVSRYRWARPFRPIYDRLLVDLLQPVDAILAAADRRVIQAFVRASGGRLRPGDVKWFPTAYDEATFRAGDKSKMRRELGIPTQASVFVSVGRLSAAKGWKEAVAAFCDLPREVCEPLLLFVGDGEDRRALEDTAAGLGLSASVRVTGFVSPAEVAQYLVAADVVVSASRQEGWSIAMLEALACGKSIVATPVGAAQHLIEEGRNGYLAESTSSLTRGMYCALALPDPNNTSIEKAAPFRRGSVIEGLSRAWPVLGSKQDR